MGDLSILYQYIPGRNISSVTYIDNAQSHGMELYINNNAIECPNAFRVEHGYQLIPSLYA